MLKLEDLLKLQQLKFYFQFNEARCCANLRSKFRLDFLTSFVAAFSASLFLPPSVVMPQVTLRCASAMSEHHYIIVRKGQTITDRGTAAYWYGVPRRCLNIITLLSERDIRSLIEGQPRIGTVCLGDV